MAIQVDATYENGVLKLDQSLPFQNKQRVRVTVDSVLNGVDRLWGMLQVDPALVDQVATNSEFSILAHSGLETQLLPGVESLDDGKGQEFAADFWERQREQIRGVSG